MRQALGSATTRQLSLIKLSPVEPDICARKHGVAETSILADKTVEKEKDRRLVYGYVKASGTFGLTLDELSILLDRPVNRISGRFTELRKRGEIVATDATRLTRTNTPARVYVAL